MRRTDPLALAALIALTAAGCAQAPEPVGALAAEEIVAVTVTNRLLRFNAGQPQRPRDARPLAGLRDGERIVGLDYRVARGELFALAVAGARAQLYRIDTAAAKALPVGAGIAVPEGVREWGFDFNPTVDRIRVVTDRGLNLRLHPDTGAQVDGDPSTAGLQGDGALAWAPGDPRAGQPLAVVAAGYTYNKNDDKLTTNYALDGAAGWLVHQGTKEGVQPAVSPNSGRIYGVGALGTGPFAQATFDISDVKNAAYAGLRAEGEKATRWYRVDLATGKATLVGTVAGEALAGAAIEP